MIRPTEKQELFIQSDVFELFYGGARGGGKTFACLMDFAGVAQVHGRFAQGMLFRRSYKELEEAIRISKELYRGRASWRVGDKQWTFKNGAVLKMRFLERDDDVEKYQGFSLCLHTEDTVVMEDMGIKKIKDVKRGDRIMTLEGPKEVIGKTEPYEAECVKVAGQINPIDHPVLTAWGWQSYASLLESYSKGSAKKYPVSGKPLSLYVPLRQLRHMAYQDESSEQKSILFGKPGISTALFQVRNKYLSSFLLGLRRFFLPAQSLLSYILAYCGNVYALRYLGRALNWKAHYWYGRRRHGGPLLGLKGTDRDVPPSLDDAGQQDHYSYKRGVRGSIRQYIRHVFDTYEHPYDGTERQAQGCDFHYTASKITPIGKRMVCDITVADVNHYISSYGIVNVNTNVYFDELGNYPTSFPYLFMLSNLRSTEGVPAYIRATGNPGGVGAYWVKERFITNKEPFKIYTDEDGNGRQFIPARLEDNPRLMETDYGKRLKLLPPHLYRAFRLGDWDVFSGQVFEEWDQTRHIIEPFPLDPSWYRFASMDWGYAKPYAIGFWAVTNEGRMILIHEMYGGEKANEGSRENASEVAKKAHQMAVFLGIEDMVADPAIWAKQGFSEESVANIFSEYFVMYKGINDRINGCFAFHDYLKTNLMDGGPMLVTFDTCNNFIRTIPALTADKKKAEDVDTNTEDHFYDSARYAIMFIKENVTDNSYHEHIEEKVDLLRRHLGG